MNKKINTFEEIKSWKESKQLTKEIYDEFKNIKDFNFRDQIQRASVSIINNIAEGFERSSNKEFIKFLFIAKGSCGEVRSMIILAKELGYVKKEKSTKLHSKTTTISKLLSGFIKYLRTNDS